MAKKTIRFTERWVSIAKCDAGKNQTDYYDEGHPGLLLRVSYGGTKTYVAWYVIEGRTRKKSLGHPPKMKLKQARAQANAVRAKAAEGEDVQGLAQAERKAETFAELAHLYVEKHAKPKKKASSCKEDQRMLNKDVLPLWETRKAKTITRRDVINLVEGIAERGTPTLANRVLALVRKIFNFGIQWEVVEINPCAQVPRPGKEVPRDRVLRPDEIKPVCIGLGTANLSAKVRHALKLQLMCALRSGEVARSRWEEFDFNENVWTIPAERSKNGNAHRVPLPPQVLEVLEQVKKEAGESEFLFPTTKRDRSVGPLNPDALAKGVYRNLEHFGTDPFTPHDLRRTAATLMTGMGVDRLVVSKLLNHVEPGVTAVYDRHSYDDQKRAALEAWNNELDRMVKA